LDAIRTIGNFAAHPIKSTSSGEIVDVEPGEAEWFKYCRSAIRFLLCRTIEKCRQESGTQ
jgi:hypothetical protein